MRKLSDYKGDEAIELWADLLLPITNMMRDSTIRDGLASGKPSIETAQDLLRSHKEEVTQILLRIDSTPLDGLNIVVRLIELLVEIEKSPDLKGFFGSAERVTT